VIFEVDAGGVRRRIEARRRPDGTWVARLDGRQVLATLVRAGNGYALLIAPRERGACDAEEAGAASGRVFRSFDIAIEAASRRGGAMTVYVNGRAVPLSMSECGQRARSGRERTEGTVGGARPAVVTAPMPGRVAKVLVKPGDAVVARQGVVVVEAMKMENELRAPRAGTVAEVCVREGMSVEAHAPLVMIT
jgi:biotin carboxyl carrier protein